MKKFTTQDVLDALGKFVGNTADRFDLGSEMIRTGGEASEAFRAIGEAVRDRKIISRKIGKGDSLRHQIELRK
jgi:hypothetical protein